MRHVTSKRRYAITINDGESNVILKGRKGILWSDSEWTEDLSLFQTSIDLMTREKKRKSDIHVFSYNDRD